MNTRKLLPTLVGLIIIITFLSGCETAPSTPTNSTSSSSTTSSTPITSAPSTPSTSGPGTPEQTPDTSVSGLDGDTVSGQGGQSQVAASADNSPSSGFGQRIAAEAKKLIGSVNFRSAAVNFGRKACAQVVSTALKAAGAIEKVTLNVRDLIKTLKGKGWAEVKPPPFKEGDVITWATYDYTGDGKIDPDTHVGIMVKDGGTFKAMNNSSSLKKPQLTSPYAFKRVSRVLRKAA